MPGSDGSTDPLERRRRSLCTSTTTDPTSGFRVMALAYLMLYGNGWTQRWRLADGEEDRARSEITGIGKEGTGQLSVIDSRTDTPVVLVVSWAAVAAAAAVVLDADPDPQHDTATGQCA